MTICRVSFWVGVVVLTASWILQLIVYEGNQTGILLFAFSGTALALVMILFGGLGAWPRVARALNYPIGRRLLSAKNALNTFMGVAALFVVLFLLLELTYGREMSRAWGAYHLAPVFLICVIVATVLTRYGPE